MEQFKVGITAEFGPGGEFELLLDDTPANLFAGVDNIVYDFLPEYTPVVKPEQIREFDVVITNTPSWTRESLNGLERLTGIARWGVGYDRIDVEAATDAGVIVSITTQAARSSMAEAIVALLLALSKHLLIKDRLTRTGRSDERTRYNGVLVRDRVVGIIGPGNIGGEVARLLRSFEPREILACNLHGRSTRVEELGVRLVELDTLLSESDFVVVACPLTEKTRGMMGEREFRLMKPTASFVNAARGGIVHQESLTRALQEGWIRGAALDVLEVEPPPPTEPLLQMEQTILTPHCIGWTEELIRDTWSEACKAAMSICQGTAPATVVNREVLEHPGLQAKLRRYSRRQVS